MENNPIILLRLVYPAPVEKVWQAISQKEDLKKWYFDFAEDWNLTPGSVFEWVAGPPDGKQWLHRGVMLEATVNKKLSHTWEYPGYTGTSVVTWHLEAIDTEQTALEFTHEFIVPFDEKEAALQQKNFEAGWEQILQQGLTDYLK